MEDLRKLKPNEDRLSPAGVLTTVFAVATIFFIAINSFELIEKEFQNPSPSLSIVVGFLSGITAI